MTSRIVRCVWSETGAACPWTIRYDQKVNDHVGDEQPQWSAGHWTRWDHPARVLANSHPALQVEADLLVSRVPVTAVVIWIIPGRTGAASTRTYWMSFQK